MSGGDMFAARIFSAIGRIYPAPVRPWGKEQARLKICCICESTNPNARLYCGRLVSAGYHVDVIALPGFGAWNLDGARIFRLRGLSFHCRSVSYLNRLFYGAQCFHIVRAVRPDVLNAIFLFDCGFLAATTGYHPLALTPLGSDVLLYPFQKKKWMSMMRLMIRRADCIFSNSAVMTSTLVNRLGAPADKVEHLVWNGVDTRAFRPFDAQILKARYTSPAGCLLFSNRLLSPLYNIDSIIRMFARFHRAAPDSHLLVAADGPQRNFLRSLSREYGVADAVTFTGRIPSERMPEYINACDLFITVPSSDSCASSLLEALACQKTVIASDIEANRAWIMHGENGWLVDAGDIESFSQTCLRAWRNRLSARGLEQNRGRVAATASIERGMALLKEAFAGLVSRRHTARPVD